MKIAATPCSLVEIYRSFEENRCPYREYFGLRNRIQGDSEERVNTFGGDSIYHCEKKVSISMCLIVNGYRNRDVGISRTKAVRFFCVVG